MKLNRDGINSNNKYRKNRGGLTLRIPFPRKITHILRLNKLPAEYSFSKIKLTLFVFLNAKK